jgi:Fe2+ or Zn2+ uptake regulation protein
MVLIRNVLNNDMISIEEYCQGLRSSGRRITAQRRAIIQVLVDPETHMTADQVFRQARLALPSVSRATVYNTLHELVATGLLVELNLGLGERHYEIPSNHHAHLVCQKCGKVRDTPLDTRSITLSPSQTQGFRAVTCNLVFLGYCPACSSDVEEHDLPQATAKKEALPNG